MDNPTPSNNSQSQNLGLNKIDLSELQGFTFGIQWTEAKTYSSQQQPNRRDGPRADNEMKRRHRGSRHPASGPGGSKPAPALSGSAYPPRERRDFRGGSKSRNLCGESGSQEGRAPFERGPYISPFFALTCYPEDVGFAAMVKAVRASCRTFQLFEITKAVLEKNERLVVVIQRKPTSDAKPAASETRATSPGKTRFAPARSAKSEPIFISVPDDLPFDTEDAAIQYVIKNHLGLFFDTQDVETEAPKGNFPIINKDSITGELLGPPNYHRYRQILQERHAAHLSYMSFEKFKKSIISVRKPEVVQQWLDKMKKVTRYKWKTEPVSAAPEVAPAPVAAAAAETSASEPAPKISPTVEAAGPSFGSIEEARAYLLAQAKERVVRAVDTVRFHGRFVEKLPPGEIRQAIEGHVEHQRRFPLDTANALRGRLRREGFRIFRKGSNGISYVCAVKRRFRVPGQVFSDTITALIEFIEKNAMVHAKDLPVKFLSVDVGEALAATALPEGTSPAQAPGLSPEQAGCLRKMSNDLRWLVSEGYVMEFSDGKLFTPPISQQTRKGQKHGEMHDPADFPEVPPTPTQATALTPRPALEKEKTAIDFASIAPKEMTAPLNQQLRIRKSCHQPNARSQGDLPAAGRAEARL